MSLRWCRGARAGRKLSCRRNCRPARIMLPRVTIRRLRNKVESRFLSSSCIISSRPQSFAEKTTMAQLQSTYRDAGNVTVLDLSGRITLGEGSALLRTTIKDLLAEDRLLILVNLADVNYIDSSGIGELVTSFTTVKNRGGQLKLLHLTKKVKDLLQITKLFTVFDVYENEREALSKFDGASTPS